MPDEVIADLPADVHLRKHSPRVYLALLAGKHRPPSAAVLVEERRSEASAIA